MKPKAEVNAAKKKKGKRVMKVRTRKDAKGYTVMEDYSSYEEMTEAELAPPK